MIHSNSFASAVEKLIKDAKTVGDVVRTGESAKRLSSEHPDCGVSRREIAEIVARQAVAAGVPIQFTNPD